MKKPLPYLSVITMVALLFNAVSARPADYFEARSHTFGGRTIPYRLFIPYDYDPGRPYPLILTLHGGSGRGDDNWTHITYHSVAEVWAESTHQAVRPCFVVAPQSPGDTGIRWRHLADLLNDLLGKLFKEFNINTKRVYVTGVSFGGYGSWEMIQLYPNLFAAAAPMAGGCGICEANTIKDIPVWIFHSIDDDVVTVSNARNMVSKLTNAGAEFTYTFYKNGAPAPILFSNQLDSVVRAGDSHLYTELPNSGHNVYNVAFGMAPFFTWMFSQSKDGFTSVRTRSLGLPANYSLSTGYPTGKNASLFDLNGRQITGNKGSLSARGIPTGIYLYRNAGHGTMRCVKMLKLK